MSNRNIILLVIMIIAVFSFPDTANGQWIPTNGIWGLNVHSITVSLNNFFAGTSYGLLRSGDDGATWTRCDNGLPNTTVFALASGVTTIFAGFSSGLFRSTDNGASWTEITTLPSPYTNISSIGVYGTTVFVSASSGSGVISYEVFCSTDNGESWIEVDSSLSERGFSCFTESQSTLFTGGFGIHRSTDDGKTWSDILPDIQVFALRANGHVLFAGGVGRIWRSTDNGLTWTYYNVTGSADHVTGFEFFWDIILAATTDGTFSSVDTGKTWVFNDSLPSDISSFGANGSVTVAGTDSGIFISTDRGHNWNPVNAGLTASTITTLVSSENVIIAGTDRGIYLSADNGIDWAVADFNSFFPRDVYLSIGSDGTIYAGSYGGVYLSGDNGATWNKARNTGLPINCFDDPFNSTICLNYDLTGIAVGDNNTLFTVYNGSMYRSVDYGENWSSLSLKCNTIVAPNSKALFAGTDSSGIFRSTDMGENWTEVNTGITNKNIVSLASNGDCIYTGTNGGIFSSDNNGETWMPCAARLSDCIVTAFTAFDSALFAGTKTEGIFISTDNGSHWTPVNEGLSIGYPVTSFALQNETLFAGTRLFGIWRRPLSEMLGTANVQPQWKLSDRKYRRIRTLARNGSAVVIEFAIVHPVPVTIMIYDMRGREVTSLVNRNLDAGEHRYYWDTHTFARGCYFVRFQIGADNYIEPVHIVN